MIRIGCLTFLLFFSFLKFCFGLKSTCLYYGNFSELVDQSTFLTNNTCSLFNSIVKKLDNNIITETKVLNYDNLRNAVTSDIIYIATFGNSDYVYLSNQYRISWCDVSNVINQTTDKIWLIDACYSGSIFNCDNLNTNENVIITSTNDVSVSVNTVVDNKFYSTFILALSCLVDVNSFNFCRQYIGCYEEDPQLCQFQIMIEMNIFDNSIYNSLFFYKELHPDLSMGTMLFNGLPWRHF